MVYRGQIRLSPQQIRAAIEALPYENPKLSAVERLERAIARSNGARLIEARAEPTD